jgi:hypothetical protein
MPNKPTGTMGVNRVKVEAGGTASHSFEKIEFPKEKSDIEALMVSDFLSSMNRVMSQEGTRWFMSDPKQNHENDFDYTVTLPDGSSRARV